MNKGPYPYLALSFVIYCLDQLSKALVRRYLPQDEVVKVTSFFNLVYVENPGAAFGMFKSLGNAFFIVISLLASVAMAALVWKDPTNRLACSLLLSGALGNMTDRIIYGTVTDFLDLHIAGYHWYAFNVADSALTVGMILMLINGFLIAGKRPSTFR
jgi:signal peptidase II